MAKDEDHIINEWIVHHILLGFEHIYIYDDQSNYPISERIKELPECIQEKVTVYFFGFAVLLPQQTLIFLFIFRSI